MGYRIRHVSIVVVHLVLCVFGFSSIDQTKYEEGKRQLELVEKNSQMPRYGKCWRNAVVDIQVGCRRLTDVVQSRLALAYLNCFLEIQGRDTYPCERNEPIAVCTKFLSDVDRNSFTTFFTHTQNICYFLQAQSWQQGTEQTIVELSTQSKSLVSELHEASRLQHEINRKQTEALDNQEEILERASDLNDVITSSSDNIQGMFEKFKNSTDEQRMLISDVFDKVTKLHSTIVDEFSGLYTLVYYTFVVIVCYFITSTNRTAAARLSLFALMTINLLIERTCLENLKDFFSQYVQVSQSIDQTVLLYESCWMCRKFFAAIALLILLVFILQYKDIDVINNRLLQEIHKQNTELKHFLQGSLDSRKINTVVPQETTPAGTVETSQADSTGYESGLEISDSDSEVTMTTESKSRRTDNTYRVQGDSDSSTTDTSFSTALTRSSASTKVSTASSRGRSLVKELRDLKNSTPFKELTGPLLNWAKTGYYRPTLSARHLDEDSDESVFSYTDDRRMTRSRSRSPSLQQNRPSQKPSNVSSFTHVQQSSYHPQASTSQLPADRGVSQHTSPRDNIEEYPPFSKPYALRARHLANQRNDIVESESPRSFTKNVRRLEKLAIKNSRLVKRAILREEKMTKSSGDEI